MTALLSRRALLGAAPAAAALAALPAIPAALRVTAQERYQHHLDGLLSALHELDPQASAWCEWRGEGWGRGLRFAVLATTDRSLSYGRCIGGMFPPDRFTRFDQPRGRIIAEQA